MANGDVLRDRPILSASAKEALAADPDSLGRIDVLTAGYPCQPFSTAAHGDNTATDLWPETLRIIRLVRPPWVVLENVPGYDLEHIERSCSDLEGLGYAVWPLDIAVEIRNHVRRRIWVVAYTDSESESRRAEHGEMACVCTHSEGRRDQPEPMGMDDGLPGRMDRLRSLGNSIFTGIAEAIFRAIGEAKLP